MSDEIRFYHLDQAYGEFSNFARYPITLMGLVWPTSEHWFQAQKYATVDGGEAIMEAIRRDPSPRQAFRMGRSPDHRRRPDWGKVRDDVMREAVRAKFRQHADLRALLLSTGESRIVEHTENDDYWGDGGDGHGRNRLGEILMEVREELRRDA